MSENMFKMVYFIFIIMFFTWFFNNTLMTMGLKLSGPNVCLKNNSEQYCCFNHYHMDGRCVECENGTVSTDGIHCLPCEENRYGRKCSFTCSCSSDQRCDPQVGCVPSDSKNSVQKESFGLTAFSSIAITVGTIGSVTCCTAIGWFLCRRKVRSLENHKRQESEKEDKLQARPLPSPKKHLSEHIYHVADYIQSQDVGLPTNHSAEANYPTVQDDLYVEPYNILNLETKNHTRLLEYDHCVLTDKTVVKDTNDSTSEA